MIGKGGETSASSKITQGNVQAPSALLHGVIGVVGKAGLHQQAPGPAAGQSCLTTATMGIEGIW